MVIIIEVVTVIKSFVVIKNHTHVFSDPDINIKIENTLLKELIAEVRINNYLLRENNGLLLQRIRDLEEKVMTQKYKSKQKDDLQFSSSRNSTAGKRNGIRMQQCCHYQGDQR
ncbi:hypothetical protein JTB14_009630 [Gonioctena quinquepunctata]|nr:hypothetical protein JTB14_009630 [Gonioctena quinquepunctata]